MVHGWRRNAPRHRLNPPRVALQHQPSTLISISPLGTHLVEVSVQISSQSKDGLFRGSSPPAPSNQTGALSVYLYHLPFYFHKELTILRNFPIDLFPAYDWLLP